MLTYGEMQRDSVFEFFIIELQLTYTFTVGKVKCKYANQKHMYDFLFYGTFALSATAFEIFEICITLILTFRNGQDQM